VGEERKEIDGSVGKTEREVKIKLSKRKGKTVAVKRYKIELKGQQLLRDERVHHWVVPRGRNKRLQWSCSKR
jgi:hypothetical protein